MSATSNPSTPIKIASDETEHCLIPAKNLQSSISSHHEKSATLVMVPRGDKGLEWQSELQRARDDFDNDRITWTECSTVINCILAASDAEYERILDFEAREQAGQAKPRDFYVLVYGYTEEEAEEYIQAGAREMIAREANKSYARTRNLRGSRHGCDH
ncbi:hypothetical protein EWM64_g6804 [Hericium alpestre]|uniref:Uncharacterized protein n=1 Tax=Hericium alpestre TaxID=135208 RepID=A0A4Y9ZUP0_9AGAM|nr:hypothetical protein EWM64_g6804 [Hericium alpestre]